MKNLRERGIVCHESRREIIIIHNLEKVNKVREFPPSPIYGKCYYPTFEIVPFPVEVNQELKAVFTIASRGFVVVPVE